MRIINIYDHRAMETVERPVRGLNWQKIIRQGGGGTVHMEYFNTQGYRWDPRCTEQREVTYWEEILAEHWLAIGNDDSLTHYWMRNESQQESIIGLTMANQPFSKWKILDENRARGSDHKIIEWEVDIEKQ